MDKRVMVIRDKTERFGITQSRLAAASGLALVTVKKVLSPMGNNARYLNETTLSTIEAGLERILQEYRDNLCG